MFYDFYVIGFVTIMLRSATFVRDISQEEEKRSIKQEGKINGNAEEVREELTTHTCTHIYNIL